MKSTLLDTIRRSGAVTFEYFMSVCLYHPEHGYYMQDRATTGVAGDYFTSADLHPIFARLIARQAAEMWEIMERPAPFTFVEMGAGRGLFAADFLKWVNRALPDFAAALEYVALEPAAGRRERLTQSAGAIHPRFRALAKLEDLGEVTGCFFSNELVDAFPVHVVTRASGRLREIYVTREGDELAEKLGVMSDARVAAYVARYAKELEEGHRAEVNLAAVLWMRQVAGRLKRGFAITIDYGDHAHRLYTPDRPRGTLMAYRGHSASENYFDAPGEQDLTAHVNFSALIDSGEEAGLSFAGFTTQERFLLAIGEANQFADLYDEGQPEAQRLEARLKLKRLINPEPPDGMGTLFKVLIQQKGIGGVKLAGLKFAKP